MSSTAITPAQFASAAEKLPSTPQVYAKLNAAMKNPDTSLDEIVAIVRLDPSLSARVMRLSNSPMFGRGQPVDNLIDAINRTGVNEIYRLVGAAMTSQLFVTGLPIYGLGGDELCANSLATAIAAEQIAERTAQDPHHAYTLGLLRSVGRLLLQRLSNLCTCPPMSGKLASSELVLAWEQKTFGRNHASAAAELFKIWKFPGHLGTPIQNQYQPEKAKEEFARASAQLHLAAYVADQIGCGLTIDKDAFRADDAILAQAGIGASDLANCAEATKASTAAMTLMLNAS